MRKRMKCCGNDPNSSPSYIMHRSNINGNVKPNGHVQSKYIYHCFKGRRRRCTRFAAGTHANLIAGLVKSCLAAFQHYGSTECPRRQFERACINNPVIFIIIPNITPLITWLVINTVFCRSIFVKKMRSNDTSS